MSGYFSCDRCDRLCYSGDGCTEDPDTQNLICVDCTDDLPDECFTDANRCELKPGWREIEEAEDEN